MVRIVDSDIEIVYEQELFMEPLPRAVVLVAGLALTAGASTTGLLQWLQPGLTDWAARDLYLVCAGGAAVGLALSLRAVLNPDDRMSSVTIGDEGITFRWRRGGIQERFVGWHDMEQVTWTEEGQEHEFKQFLNVRLRQPVLGRRRVFRFLICDTRAYRECHALHAKMPAHAPRPASLKEALKFE